ncbi:MAG: DNA topoisomerase IV subunit B, partial [Nitrospinaceae bacterium]
GLNGAQYEVGRFKGLGEMPSEVLKSTTMDKNKRTLIRVTIENNKRADKTFDRLMGKEAQHRFKFIQEKAPFFKELDV